MSSFAASAAQVALSHASFGTTWIVLGGLGLLVAIRVWPRTDYDVPGHDHDRRPVSAR